MILQWYLVSYFLTMSYFLTIMDWQLRFVTSDIWAIWLWKNSVLYDAKRNCNASRERGRAGRCGALHRHRISVFCGTVSALLHRMIVLKAKHTEGLMYFFCHLLPFSIGFSSFFHFCMADYRLLEIAENRYKDLFDSEESLEQMSRRVFVYSESTSASLLQR